MRRILSILFLFFVPLFSSPEKKVETVKRYKIGVCIMATGPYCACAQSLIESGRRFFCRDHDVTYLVFTDGSHVDETKDVVRIQQTQLGWPYDTLKRVHVYDEHQQLFEKFDYIFAIDANMFFVAPVGNEIFGDLIGTQHPAFLNKRGSYESKKISSAYVGPQEGRHYFTSRFYGGKKTEFVKLIRGMRKLIDSDLAKDFIAKFHEESYLNRFFIDHSPSRILSPSYCYPENWQLDFPKKLVDACPIQEMNKKKD